MYSLGILLNGLLVNTVRGKTSNKMKLPHMYPPTSRDTMIRVAGFRVTQRCGYFSRTRVHNRRREYGVEEMSRAIVGLPHSVRAKRVGGGTFLFRHSLLKKRSNVLSLYTKTLD